MASIAELLAEQGRVLADARRRSGERRGMLVSSLGQIPGQIMADRQAQQAQRFEQAQMMAQGIRQRRTDERLESADARAQAEFDARRQEQNRHQAALEAQKVAAAGYRDVPQWIQSATQRGLWSPEEGAQLLQQAADPDGAKRIVDFIAPLADPKAAPALIQRDPTRDLVDPTTGRVVTPGTPEPPRADTVTFSAPQPVMVGGRRVLARAGSDGAMYDMRGQQIAEVSPDIPPTTAAQAQGPQPGWQWVDRDGAPVHTNRPQPGDKPLRAPQNTGNTAQDRQRDARTTAARDFLGRLNELRGKINTRMGPSAGIAGYARRAGAAVGMDPDVAEYERIRAAGGRSLAVAIMGAQNLSDADAAAWANMLPDARTDEETAKRLTTQVERMLDGMTGTGSAAPKGPPRNDEPAAGVETPAQRAKRLYDELAR